MFPSISLPSFDRPQVCQRAARAPRTPARCATIAAKKVRGRAVTCVTAFGGAQMGRWTVTLDHPHEAPGLC